MKILILGVNGFIGSNLSEKILTQTNWEIFGLDIAANKIQDFLHHKNFHFHNGDITLEKKWVKEHIALADVVLPLVAIANPSVYVTNPLKIFELDFEANLEIIRWCVHLNKRIIFPSTSEVYGMCPDKEFDEELSNLVTGPIHKERWIYSASKQLLDRIIYAYGNHHNLNYTLFRPFNWYGPKLDDIFNSKPGASRVLTQFIGNIIRGEDINLVDGGEQKRCFLHIYDGVSALIKIIENKDNSATQRIFNVGNPNENISIRQLAEILIAKIKQYPAYARNAENTQLKFTTSEEYYGAGYQDVELRVPSVERAKEYLNWQPKISIDEGISQTLNFYLQDQGVVESV